MQPTTDAVLTILQMLAIVAAAIWVVGSIKAKTHELSVALLNLTDSIRKLDRAVERLDEATRQLDRRVTILEVHHDHQADSA